MMFKVYYKKDSKLLVEYVKAVNSKQALLLASHAIIRRNKEDIVLVMVVKVESTWDMVKGA